MRALLLGFSMLFTLSAGADSGNAWDVLGGEAGGVPAHLMLQNHLDQKAVHRFALRRERLESLTTEADIKAYQEEKRAFFVRQLGGFPERTPLNSRVVGRGEGAGVRFEKIIFESQPGYFVTAVLYLPQGKGPFPAVLVPCGHSDNGKAAETYQRACILLAQNGIAAFCYDPIGQGERYHFLDAKGKPTLGTTIEHTLLGVGCILTGTNIAMYRIWDGMRALDYLESRPDIDASRLGCTGNSGGGTLSSYIMALDDRVQVAAPSCYLTTFDRLLATIGPQDAEQNIHGQVAFGMDHADYVIMRAPNPTLVCTATHDFFDIAGSWDTYRQAKRIFTSLGFPERVDLVEANEKHGFTKPLREAVAQWMCRWLLGRDEPVREGEFEIFTDEELQCTPGGQVLRMEGTRSLPDLSIERMEKLKARRTQSWAAKNQAERREQIASVLGLGELTGFSSLAVRETESLEKDGRVIRKMIIESDPAILLPTIVVENQQTPDANVLVLNGANKALEFEEDGRAWDLSQYAVRVILSDLRGIGETENDKNHHGWISSVGPDWPDYFRAYLLGESIVAMRVRDILSLAQYLNEAPKDGGEAIPLHMIATGEATVPALHAAALVPELFASIEIVDGIPTWEAVLRAPRAKDQLVNAVHGALAHYDLPDLVELAGVDKVKITQPEVQEF